MFEKTYLLSPERIHLLRKIWLAKNIKSKVKFLFYVKIMSVFMCELYFIVFKTINIFILIKTGKIKLF